MKYLRAICLLASIASSAWSATAPLYQNDIVFSGVAPQIDAVRFVNNSVFDIVSLSLGIPFDTSNTRFFTNNGDMYNSDGFRIETVTGGRRKMMDAFANIGTIDTVSYLSVSATNIMSSGFLFSGGSGLLSVEGKNVNLENGGLRTAGSSLSTVYYALGTGNDQSGTNVYTIRLTPNYQLPFPFSPDHQVLSPGGGGNTRVRVPAGNNDTRSFSGYVYTNGNTVQIIFVPDSTYDSISGAPLVTTQVRFSQLSSVILGGNGGGVIIGGVLGNGDMTPIVEFSAPEYDVVTDSVFTNYLYFEDSSATTTNYQLVATTAGGFVPNTYNVSTAQPIGWDPFYSTNANGFYVPSLIYSPAFVTNTVTNSYFAYSAQVGPATVALGQSITNVVGRIQISADNLNLKGARIRGDSGLIVNAKNLVDNEFPLVDSPYATYNLGSTNGKLVLKNVGGNLVSRFGGTISAWTGVWYNQPTTNANEPIIKYHICFVDFNAQNASQVTQIDSLSASADHVVFDGTADTVNNSLSIKAKAMTITPSGSLGYSGSFFGTGTGLGIASNNAPSLTLVTNQGAIYVPGVLNFGQDRPKPYTNIINSGVIQASAVYLRASNVTDSGTVYSFSGSVNVDALRALFSGDLIYTYSAVRVNARDMVASNSYFLSGLSSGLGRIELSVTNDLNDNGITGENFWQVGAGFSLNRLPKKTSSLLGTTIQSTAVRFQNSSHTWASTNLGAIAAGYSNNAALGGLVLDGLGDIYSTFSFSGVGKKSAIYVDYLDFEDYATNFSHLSIATNFTIYFADSNLKAEQIDGALGGRIRWVPSYAGSYSSITVTNLAGDVFQVNRQLAQSTTIDSDGDGIPNASDPNPWEYIAPSIFTQPTNQTVNVGSTLSVSAVIRGALPRTYQWYRNNAKVAAGTNEILVIPNVQLANAGSYFVVVDNDLGSATSSAAIITVVNPYQSRGGVYSGLFGNPVSYQFASSGSAQLTVTSSGTFSGQIRIQGGSYSITGKFDPTGSNTVQVARAGQNTLTCKFAMDLVGSNTITGTVSDGVFTVPLHLDRAVFSASRPAPYAGRYTLAIPGASPVLGDGIGTVTISSAGVATFSGVLADGTAVTQSANVSESGSWPVYLPLYTGNGMVISWVQFATNAPATLGGTAVWTKNAVGGKYYPNGFRVSSSITGNAYVPPPAGQRVLNLVNATITLSAGNLASSITNSAVLGVDNVFTITGTNNLSLTVTLPTGLVNGSFRHPVTQQMTPIVGVTRQGTNLIQGHFVGTSQSGRLLLLPAP